jgi:hypothetical protein
LEFQNSLLIWFESIRKLTVDIEEDHWKEVHAEYSGYERGFWTECKTDFSNILGAIVWREG